MKQSMIAFEHYCAQGTITLGLELNHKIVLSRIVELDTYTDNHIRHEYNAFKAAFNSQQAIIDRLMLEYCPKEMTQLQMSEWENSQVSLIESVSHE